MPSVRRSPKSISITGIMYDRIFEIPVLKKSNENKVYLNASTFVSLNTPEIINKSPVSILKNGFIYFTNLKFVLFTFCPKIQIILRWITGHIIETALPGDDGRCVISGYRTTYGAPFNRIDELVIGDLIYLETFKGEIFTYVVTDLIVVNPADVYILEGDSKKELLLSACESKYSAAKRLVVISELIRIYNFNY